MVVETVKDQIVLNQLIGQKKEIKQIETDVIVNDIKPDVLKIINTNGVVSIYKKEVMDGKVRVDGAINTYIIYMADDEKGETRTINTTLDFSQIIDMENCRDDMQARNRCESKKFRNQNN